MEQFGPYRIDGLLGRGGMGQVHRAYDTAHDRVVALKLLSGPNAADEAFRAGFVLDPVTTVHFGIFDPEAGARHGAVQRPARGLQAVRVRRRGHARRSSRGGRVHGFERRRRQDRQCGVPPTMFWKNASIDAASRNGGTSLRSRAEVPNPIPGEYLTCFLGDPAQLVWTEKENLVAGILLSTKVTDNDQLDMLYQWWNTEILVDMGSA
jgi:hypothetical protein